MDIQDEILDILSIHVWIKHQTTTGTRAVRAHINS